MCQREDKDNSGSRKDIRKGYEILGNLQKRKTLTFEISLV
jgi:hypothetical protein